MSLKTVCTLFFIVLFFSLHAQTSDALMVFNASGQISIERNKVSITKLTGASIIKNDILKVSDGSITIVSPAHKRIDISKPGTYTYKTIADMLAKEESSLSNRYFVYVWEKMNKDEQPTNTPGGIVRGDEALLLPADSLYVLSDSITFFYPNEDLHKYVLTIYDATYDIIYQTNFNDSVFATSVALLECTKPGRYTWELSVPYIKSPDARCFFIPDAEKRAALLESYKSAYELFSNYPEPLKAALIHAYCIENKIYSAGPI